MLTFYSVTAHVHLAHVSSCTHCCRSRTMLQDNTVGKSILGGTGISSAGLTKDERKACWIGIGTRRWPFLQHAAVTCTTALGLGVAGPSHPDPPPVHSLPQPRRLDNLFDELLKGALDALFCLGRGLDEHHLIPSGALEPLLLADHPLALPVRLVSHQHLDQVMVGRVRLQLVEPVFDLLKGLSARRKFCGFEAGTFIWI